MTEPALHSTPGVREVLAQQIRTTGRSLKRVAALGFVVLIVGTIFVLINGGEIEQFHPERWLPFGIIGLAFPIAVWKSDKPFGAGMFWTLPVDRRTHALIKVAAGWVWLMAAVALCFVWLIIVTLVTDGSILGEETIWFMPDYNFPAKGTLQLSDLQSRQWMPERVLWLVPFTAATGTYLLASSLAIGTRYPFRWIVGGILIFFLIMGVVSEIGLSSNNTHLALLPSKILGTAFLGRYGLDTLLAAGTEAMRMDVTLSNGSIVHVWRSLPNVADWAAATFVWITAGLIAVLAAASRHTERRSG